MSKNRISVSMDGENFFWIVIDRGKLIRNPTKEDLNDTIPRRYSSTNICPKCREENKITDRSILYPQNTLREHNKEGKETGRWLCKNCYEKYDPNSQYSARKSVANHRTENLDPGSNHAKADDFEELTHIWKGVKILSKENDNYNGPLDHSTDSKGNIPQTKGRWYDPYNQFWSFGSLDREWGKEYDYEICYCTSGDGNNIERIYEFPKKEIENKRTIIRIYKNPTNGHGDPKTSWYDKYRIVDEDELKKVNCIWKRMLEEK